MKPEIKEPPAPDPLDDYDPELLRQLWDKVKDMETMSLPSSKEEFLKMIRDKSFSNGN